MVGWKRSTKPARNRSTIIRYRLPGGPSHAFDDAVEILGPYPWKRPAQLEVANWVVDLPESISEDAIRKQVTRIGRRYLHDLESDAAAIRVKDALEAFRTIADASEQLADRLAELSKIERHYLTLFGAPDETPEIWRDQIFDRLPSIFLRAGEMELSEGSGAKWLRHVAIHTRSALDSLAAQNRPGKEKTGDLGGHGNLFRLYLASPSWLLVKMSWQLFEWAPHCLPRGTARGSLHNFLGHVHEWVTGENVSGTDKFESHLKAFAKPWRKRTDLLRAYQMLKQSLPAEESGCLDSALSGWRPDLRDYFSATVLLEGKKLKEQLAELQKILEHGPGNR